MAVTPTALHDCLKTGGSLVGKHVDAQALQHAASGLKLAVFEVDCARAKSKSAVLRSIAQSLEFPEHFGGNFDALYDCLCDSVLDQSAGLVLALRNLHETDPGLADHVASFVQVGEDVVEFARENGKKFTFILEPV